MYVNWFFPCSGIIDGISVIKQGNLVIGIFILIVGVGFAACAVLDILMLMRVSWLATFNWRRLSLNAELEPEQPTHTFCVDIWFRSTAFIVVLEQALIKPGKNLRLEWWETSTFREPRQISHRKLSVLSWIMLLVVMRMRLATEKQLVPLWI
jgi:hypothetical protein